MRATGRAAGTAASSRRSGTTCRSCATASATTRALEVVPRLRARRARDRRVVRARGRRRLVPRRADAVRRHDASRSSARWDEAIEACVGARRAGRGSPDHGRRASRGALRLAAVPRRVRSLRTSATVHPARLALGLRARACSSAESDSTSARPCAGSVATAIATTAHGLVRAGRGRARRQQRDGRLPRLPALARGRVEPHRPDRAGAGRARGARLDGRRADRRRPHARSTTCARPATGGSRSAGAAGGWASAARRLGRLEVDRGVVAQRRDGLLRFFPQLRGRRITHAWGGPIDVSPTHLPIFGSRGRVHHGFGFTGNGVGPSYLGGEILARLALDRRDELTRLALVEPDRKLMPPEPFRWAGRLG